MISGLSYRSDDVQIRLLCGTIGAMIPSDFSAELCRSRALRASMCRICRRKNMLSTDSPNRTIAMGDITVSYLLTLTARFTNLGQHGTARPAGTRQQVLF